LEGTNDIFGMAEARVVKFCTQVGYIKSKRMNGRAIAMIFVHLSVHLGQACIVIILCMLARI